MVLAMIKGGTSDPLLRWSFVIVGCVWVGLAIAKGLMGKPGPKLEGTMRKFHPWSHRVMYILVGAAALLNLAALLDRIPTLWAWNALLVLLVASIFHAIFHLWRHTSLNDGALKLMTPKIWHKYL